jgi:hypothetical protein
MNVWFTFDSWSWAIGEALLRIGFLRSLYENNVLSFLPTSLKNFWSIAYCILIRYCTAYAAPSCMEGPTVNCYKTPPLDPAGISWCTVTEHLLFILLV